MALDIFNDVNRLDFISLTYTADRREFQFPNTIWGGGVILFVIKVILTRCTALGPILTLPTQKQMPVVSGISTALQRHSGLYMLMALQPTCHNPQGVERTFILLKAKCSLFNSPQYLPRTLILRRC